jgi:dephospho-CoA kinase
MKLIVGLTGGIGSGKTTVSDALQAHGASVVDTDRIAHAMTAPGGAAMDRIRETFGPRSMAADGSMDRAWMRETVFADPTSKQQLEAILHPLIREASNQQVREATGVYVVLVVPLLIESGRWNERVHRVLVVDCPVATQVIRVQRRSQLPESQIRSIIAQQASREQRLAAASDVLFNDGSQAGLLAAAHALHIQYVATRAAANLDLAEKGI